MMVTSVINTVSRLFLLVQLFGPLRFCHATDVVSVLDNLRRFMADFGNGAVVTDIPFGVLDRFMSELVDGKVPLAPAFYAGTRGDTPSLSVEDPLGRYPILLKPLPEDVDQSSLPDPEVVFERIFQREAFIPETRAGGNMLLVNWANWFLDEFFHTQPDTDGSLFRFRTNSVDSVCTAFTHTMRLRHLYGTDALREQALRTYQGGKLKAGADGGLPSLVDVRQDTTTGQDGSYFTMSCSFDRNDTSCFEDEKFFATGHERFNFHPGHLMYTELFLREHNYMADMLQKENPGWDDQRIFGTTRVVLVHLASKFVLEEYVSSSISTSREKVILKYDPNKLRSTDYATLRNQVFLEFNHLYRWHALVAEEIEFDKGEKVGFDKFLWNPSEYKNRGGATFAKAFHRTSMGSMEAHNTPYYLKDITTRTINDERAQRLQGFNAYREHFDLPRLETFDEFQAGPEATKALKELYKTVDDVDFFVGIMIERCFSPGMSFLSETLLVTVASFAFSAILNFETIKDPYLYSEELLTRTGIGHIESTSLVDLLERHYGFSNPPCGTPLLIEGHASCNIIDSPSDWAWENMEDFIGMDFVLEPFFNGHFMTDIFACFLFSSLAIFAGFYVTHYYMKSAYDFYRELEIYDQFRFVFGFVNVSTLVVTAIPYTYFALELLFGPDMIDTAETRYRPLFSFFILHGLLYTVELCGRLVYTPQGWLLSFHHTLWYVMIAIATVTESVFFLKLDFILDLMVTFEAGLFLALMCRRFSDNMVLRTRAILWGTGIFFVTRVIQVVFLIHLFVVSWDRMRGSASDKGLLATGIIFATILVLLQFYTLAIYYRFYCSDMKALAKQKKPSVESEETKSDAAGVADSIVEPAEEVLPDADTDVVGKLPDIDGRRRSSIMASLSRRGSIARQSFSHMLEMSEELLDP